LRVSEVRLQQIINSVPALIAYVDAGQRYVYVNQLYQQRFAPLRSNIIGCTVEDVLGHELYATASPMINLVLQGQAQSYEVQPFPNVWHQIHYFPTLDEQGVVTGYYVLGTDITALKAHEAELDRVANYDPLTGLPNRRLLFDRLRQALLRADRSGKLCAICFLDLDSFKSVNDRLGHGMGDQLLMGVAHNLAEALRAEDTLARLGGDEFVVLLSELDSIDECLLILDRMLEAARQPICIGEHTLQTSASMGVSLYPSDNPDPELLLRQADMAMYRAKQSGKDGYRL
jgi:diguanylate cyclase (GGDEF)-like protein/PAS domain S-box-containing protein